MEASRDLCKAVFLKIRFSGCEWVGSESLKIKLWGFAEKKSKAKMKFYYIQLDYEFEKTVNPYDLYVDIDTIKKVPYYSE